MEEIGLQLECPQEKVIDAVRRYVSEDGRRPIQECPLRKGLTLLRTRRNSAHGNNASTSKARLSMPERTPRLAGLFESYFEYYFRFQRRRALLVGPTIGRWTAVFWDEKAIDCQLLRWLSNDLGVRAVGYCFIENDEYSYFELSSGREVELFSSFLAETDGRNFWSSNSVSPPEDDFWIANGFLKDRYHFIPGFYDLAYLRGEKSIFSCYCYGAFPDHYEEAGNLPLEKFRYFYFHTGNE